MSTIPFWDLSNEEIAALTKNGLRDAFSNGEGPTFMDNPWDVVSFNGEPFPGKCSVKCEPEIQIDQKKGPGHDGARLTLHGWLPGPVVIESLIWTRAQWEAFLELRPILIRAPAKDDDAVKAISKSRKISIRDAQNYQAALAVQHPWFAANNVNAVIVRGISLEDGSAPQSKLIRFKCIEYRPPSERKAPRKIEKAKVGVDARVDAPKAPHETGAGPGGSGHSR